MTGLPQTGIEKCAPNAQNHYTRQTCEYTVVEIGNMWIKNAWYVAAWASEISEDALLAGTYLGTPV
ncbi:MAG: hypothetical protein VB959_21110, partial [Rhodospirillales bacterium]